MPIPWGDHLDLARCVFLIEEDDLGEATTGMGRCLFHLQRDLLLETWSVRTADESVESNLRTHLHTVPAQIAENAMTD